MINLHAHQLTYTIYGITVKVATHQVAVDNAFAVQKAQRCHRFAHVKERFITHTGRVRDSSGFHRGAAALNHAVEGATVGQGHHHEHVVRILTREWEAMKLD